ncbi:MAG: hypothetical protein ACYC8V_01205 [Caulobacteraceae bacterium]
MRRAGMGRLNGAIGAWTLACLAVTGSAAHAYVLTITPGAREIYLQVGAGTYNGGNYNAGGTPGNNVTINVVSLTVPAAKVGDGVSQRMTSNSAVADSFYDGYAVCSPPNQVYVGAWSRPGAGSGAASLSVSSPATLASGGDTIPFSQISWTSRANGDATADIAAGAFNGGSVPLATIAANTWVEDCLTFSYANSAIVPSGTYRGRTVYTLSLP